MAYLHKMRQLVIGSLTGYSPTTDFKIPTKVIDLEIFDAAATAREERRMRLRGSNAYPEWALSTFEVSAVRSNKHPYECKFGDIYQLDLPFSPALDMFSDGISSVMLSCSMLVIGALSQQMLPVAAGSSFWAPKFNAPKYWVSGNTLYLAGGSRDFSICPISISAVVNAPNYTDGCDTLIKVPIPDDLVSIVTARVAQKLQGGLNGGVKDMVADGNPLQDAATTGRPR